MLEIGGAETRSLPDNAINFVVVCLQTADNANANNWSHRSAVVNITVPLYLSFAERFNDICLDSLSIMSRVICPFGILFCIANKENELFQSLVLGDFGGEHWVFAVDPVSEREDEPLNPVSVMPDELVGQMRKVLGRAAYNEEIVFLEVEPCGGAHMLGAEGEFVMLLSQEATFLIDQ